MTKRPNQVLIQQANRTISGLCAKIIAEFFRGETIFVLLNRPLGPGKHNPIKKLRAIRSGAFSFWKYFESRLQLSLQKTGYLFPGLFKQEII